MEKLGRLSTEDRDNLAAYLDGELDDDSTRRIESVLSNNTVARNDVEILARTYEMLDVLPREKAPTDFAEQTIATAKLESYKKPLSEEPWFRKTQQALVLLTWTAFMVAAATFGFAISNQWIEREQDTVINELQVIKNLDVYSEVGYSLDFLDQLSNQKDLYEDVQKGAGHE